MKIFVKKMKTMAISRKDKRQKIYIMLEGHKLKQVEKYVYLQCVIFDDGSVMKRSKRE